MERKRGRNKYLKGLKEAIVMLLLNLFFLVAIVLSSNFIGAATLSCVINASSECSGTPVWYLQNVTNETFPRYNYTVCCSSDETLSNSCSDTTVIKLHNLTNSHIQAGDFSGGQSYNNSMCLSTTPGSLSCIFEKNGNSSSCLSLGYSCLAS